MPGAQDFLLALLSLDRPRRPNVPSLSLSKLPILGSRLAAPSRSNMSLRSSGNVDEEEAEAVEDGRVYVRLGTVRPSGPPLPWKKCSHSSDAGLRVAAVHPERDLDRDEDLLVVEDRAALDSILDTLDTQLPCLEGVPPPSGLSSGSAPDSLTRARWW